MSDLIGKAWAWACGFAADGPPGWVWPAAVSAVVSAACWRALGGDPHADKFLTDHFGQVTAWMAATMAPWLAYKGWKFHVEQHTQADAARAPQAAP